MKKILAILLCLSLLLCGCGGQETAVASQAAAVSEAASAASVQEAQPAAQPVEEPEGDDMFSGRDQRIGYDEGESAFITLSGDTASCDSNAVKIEGSTITILDEGTYIISGTLDDGMIIVDSEKEDKSQLVLRDVSVTSATSAALYIKQSDKVVITLEGDNKLVNGGTFEAIDDENIDAAIFSKEDLSFNGDGALTVESPAGHGIVGNDDLVFAGGTYTVTSASHGMDANDSVRIMNSIMDLETGKDGIHVENTEDLELGFLYVRSGDLVINAEGDGLDASGYVQIDDGNFNMVTGGGSENAAVQTSHGWGMFGGGPGGRGGPGGFPGMPMDPNAAETTETTEDESTSIKGIKSDSDITISGGNFVMDCADDAIHANVSGFINGGTFEIASGDDAVHAEETLDISGGTFNITESYEGIEALNITISGGDISLVASDDGINAAGGMDQSGFGGPRPGGGPPGFGGGNGSIVISGGSVYMEASGDGIDANGALEITGGDVVVSGPTFGDTAVLDYDRSATIINATFIGTGSTMMAQSFGYSEQGTLFTRVGTIPADTTLTITDSEGNVLREQTPKLDYKLVIYSDPTVVPGETYYITINGETTEVVAY